MNTKSKEFIDIRDSFEKYIRKEIYGHKLDRASKNEKVPAGVFYDDGYVNELFKVYMSGYSYAKCLAKTDALELSD